MAPKGYKFIGATLPVSWEKKVDKILECTNEKSTDFFKRVIEAEYKKVTGATVVDDPERLSIMEKQLSIMMKKIDSINETSRSQNLYQKLLYGAISYCVKLVLQTRYYTIYHLQNLKIVTSEENTKFKNESNNLTKSSMSTYLDTVSIKNVDSIIDRLLQ